MENQLLGHLFAINAGFKRYRGTKGFGGTERRVLSEEGRSLKEMIWRVQQSSTLQGSYRSWSSELGVLHSISTPFSISSPQAATAQASHSTHTVNSKGHFQAGASALRCHMLVINDCSQLVRALLNLAPAQRNPQQMLPFWRAPGRAGCWACAQS